MYVAVCREYARWLFEHGWGMVMKCAYDVEWFFLLFFFLHELVVLII